MPLQRIPHTALIRRVWELRDNVTPYDAAYVALAEVLGATLLTADIRLSRAPGIQCQVETLLPDN
jgi:predicted nucleic acid-binding protein